MEGIWKRRGLYFFSPLFSVLVYDYIYNQVYIWVSQEVNFVGSYNLSIGIGAILMGFLSDSFCRRRVFLAIHSIVPFLLVFVYLLGNSFWPVVLFGLIYNPMSVIRANLVDNAGHRSKLHLIALSFIGSFLPDMGYAWYFTFSHDFSFYSSLILLCLSAILGYFLFIDPRDPIIKHSHIFRKVHLSTLHLPKKALFSFLAFIPIQTTFFFTGNLILFQDALENVYIAVLGLSTVLGASLSMLYKKIPHISVLTIGYGIGFLFTLIPLGAIVFYRDPLFPFFTVFVFLAALISFYFAFIYDVILASFGPRFRGTICGVLDFVFWGTYLIAVEVSKGFYDHPPWVLTVASIWFFLAFALQKVAESKRA